MGNRLDQITNEALGKLFPIFLFDYNGNRDEIYFRDYLLENPGIAQEYSELKIKLANQFPNDREGYTAGKSEFVKRITDQCNSRS